MLVYRLFRSSLALMLMGTLSIDLALQFAWAEVPGRSDEDETLPSESEWKDVASIERIDVLSLLSAQTKSNYQRIKTWRATYSVETEEYLSPAFVQDAFAGRLPPESTPALIKASDFIFKGVIDLESDQIFRERDTTRFRLLTTDSRQPIVVPGARAVDNRSVVSSEHYVYFGPKDPPATYAVCPEHPDAQNRRAGHRVSADEARNNDHGILIDPRLFFRCSTPNMSWDEADMHIGVLRGGKGPERQKDLSEKLRIQQASHNGGTWYRLRVPISFPDGRVHVVTSVWSAAAGFNPVRLTFVEGDNEQVIRKAIEWKWRHVGEIFVPERVREIWHPPHPGDVDTYRRVVILDNCDLNTPVDPRQFSYAGLGMADGDLLLDHIESAVFVMRDGRPRRLAAFNEPYEAPGPASRSSPSRWLVVGNCVLAIIMALFFFAKYVVKRRTLGSIP